jgi:ABC-type transport system substrate-binding protein
VITEQLKPAGITVKLEVLDQPTWLGRMFRGQGVNFAIHCCVRQPDPDIWLTDAFTPTGGAIAVSKYNLEADLLPARRELDPKKREQMYHEIQRKLMRDVPMIPLMMRPEAMLHSPKLQGMPSLEPIWGLDITRLTFN